MDSSLVTTDVLLKAGESRSFFYTPDKRDTLLSETIMSRQCVCVRVTKRHLKDSKSSLMFLFEDARQWFVRKRIERRHVKKNTSTKKITPYNVHSKARLLLLVVSQRGVACAIVPHLLEGGGGRGGGAAAAFVGAAPPRLTCLFSASQ
jgi:hypothetical protein